MSPPCKRITENVQCETASFTPSHSNLPHQTESLVGMMARILNLCCPWGLADTGPYVGFLVLL